MRTALPARLRRDTVRADVVAVLVALGLFAVAAAVGGLLHLLGRPVYASAAPLYAHWRPHIGPGTPLALAVAVLVCWRGPALATRLPWRRLLALSYAAAVAWTLSLALIDGWQRGIVDRLTNRHEYLHEVPGVTDVTAMLGTFTTRILDLQPDSWATHVSGHPPGALLVFVWLDRVGLNGGGWAGALCILTAALTAVAVPHTVRLLGGDDAARAVLPFAVLFPGAVWSGVSADGLFAGVTATGVALLAYGVTRGSAAGAFVGGALLGFGCYLSYGLVLMVPIALTAAILGRRHRPTAWWALAGAALVAGAFTAAGFDWLTGYHLVIERYYQGVASRRAYGYWIWANLALLVVAAGPAATVILRRATVAGWRSIASPRPRAGPVERIGGNPGYATWLLPLAAAATIVAADLSGYSKAEVERIWLPFTGWFMAGAALIPGPDRRSWLTGQAAMALAVNHLLLTAW
jgi:methylthioxylose transferase